MVNLESVKMSGWCSQEPQQDYEDSARFFLFVCFFTFSQGKRRRCYEDETDEEKQKGQLSQNSLWLVVGGRYEGFHRERGTKGGH